MGSQQLIANELLAFIQHAIDTMDEVSIVQICKSSFKEDEISSGKRLLFQTLGKLDQMPSRRRDGTDKSVYDIIALLKVTDPDHVPAFVAKELHKLPPVTFDHVDVTRLLKDVNTLKTSLAEMQSKLEASEITISDLRVEVVLLRNAVPVSRSPDACNVNMRRGGQTVSVSSFESANASPRAHVSSPGVVDRPAPPALAPIPRPPSEVTACVGTCTPKRAYAAVAAVNKQPAVKQKRKLPKKSAQKGPEQVSKPEQIDDDGFIKVVKKKRKPASRNQCGTAIVGKQHLLRPAVPTTLLYVSRLHYCTKAEDLVQYMLVKTNFSLRVQRLVSRHDVNFNSFVVKVPTEHLSTFTKEEFWPKGVVFRKFRGRIPDTARHTAPLTSVK